jgi:hypothetical protein
VHQRLDRLPGPLRQQPGGEEALQQDGLRGEVPPL